MGEWRVTSQIEMQRDAWSDTKVDMKIKDYENIQSVGHDTCIDDYVSVSETFIIYQYVDRT